MNSPTQPPFDPTAPMVQLAAGWYPDPLNQNLMRYNDGSRWTYWTATPKAQPSPDQDSAEASLLEPPAATAVLRDDIAEAVKRAQSTLGAIKELRRLPAKLEPEEAVLEVVAALSPVTAGTGALVVTNRRVLFTFEGLVRSEFVFAGLDVLHEVYYNPTNQQVEVHTRKRTKRSTPLFAVRVVPVSEAHRIVAAAHGVLSAPRLTAR